VETRGRIKANEVKKKMGVWRERVKVVEPARENLSFKKRQKGKGRLGTRE
jgi:hypothetical protein